MRPAPQPSGRRDPASASSCVVPFSRMLGAARSIDEKPTFRRPILAHFSMPLDRHSAGMRETTSGHQSSPSSLAHRPIARLLLVERLVGNGKASSVEQVELGPEHVGRRRVRLTYTDPRRYSNTSPEQRILEGVWTSR